MTELNINGKVARAEVEGDTPLLWVIRDHLGLTGTKYGCGVVQCGACTVHVDGAAIRSCSVPVSAIPPTARIVTIEGLGATRLKVVQQAWAELDVAQCGYCQPGMMMAASALLAQNASPSESDIRDGISNICRCGTYPRVLAAVQLAATRLAANAA
ncbi:(2Fe-2S)-binding protein [Variovorax saccharolyticus]|uniref:(2Fe-2S)-binding protein n=1 Tax=Variovorax saccharolyticus TaxID=3053516 RepID=UPI00257592D8|nr:(2Fe-2S)-binding protein [Variovorax sp. J22R187]MDM0021799.1 (2Fe-2S)-binding protein [Variovorax sp. J22R187]